MRPEGAGGGLPDRLCVFARLRLFGSAPLRFLPLPVTVARFGACARGGVGSCPGAYAAGLMTAALFGALAAWLASGGLLAMGEGLASSGERIYIHTTNNGREARLHS